MLDLVHKIWYFGGSTCRLGGSLGAGWSFVAFGRVLAWHVFGFRTTASISARDLPGASYRPLGLKPLEAQAP